jgi:hypothetical protein
MGSNVNPYAFTEKYGSSAMIFFSPLSFFFDTKRALE